MAELVIVRHAKSSWKFQDLEDFERPLNETGRNDIQLMKEHYPQRLPAPDIILASSAERTRETAQALSTYWRDLPPPLFLDELYLADAETILLALRNHGKGECVYLCGHNPGVSHAASRLCNRDLGDLPTFSAVHISLESGSGNWSSLNWDDGSFRKVLTPFRE
ncbi:SixA phosphatase family protein [Salinispira pacifica]|uniref:Phosphohistidine phosphatase SixA n=1 Tax=Salinispira pacifica TaxID=1307761 RepID=V5WJK8_9SPIO|nr:histidine phosphatase family protein [Salinispira pacifica]AHC15749.1 Phosphohistidine phosphatase SixA [Salinispira pacifica]